MSIHHTENRGTDDCSCYLSNYYDNGVSMRPSANTLKLTYNGLLAKSGATEIHALIGHSSNDNWENTTYYAMNKTDEQTFELYLPFVVQEHLNIAFKDSANNWDNNSGQNYRFDFDNPM